MKKLIEIWINRDKVRELKLKIKELENSLEYWKERCNSKILDKIYDLENVIVNDFREKRSLQRIKAEEKQRLDLEKYKKLYEDLIRPKPQLKSYNITFKDRVMEIVNAYSYEERLGSHFFYDQFGNETAMFKDVLGLRIGEVKK